MAPVKVTVGEVAFWQTFTPPLTEAVGDGFAVPDAATFCVVPPDDATVILPLGVPVAELLSLTNIGVLAIVPTDGVKLIELLYVPPLLKEISNPVGAVVIRLAERLEPETENDCAEEAVPEQVVKLLNVPVAARVAGTIEPIPEKLRLQLVVRRGQFTINII